MLHGTADVGKCKFNEVDESYGRPFLNLKVVDGDRCAFVGILLFFPGFGSVWFVSVGKVRSIDGLGFFAFLVPLDSD